MRVLLDTNVHISAVLFGGPSREILMAGVRGRLHIVSSVALLDEFEELLVEKFSFSVDAARAIRGELEAVVDVVEPEEIPEICRDPDDNQVLGAAATGGVEAIVTGDKDLLDLGSYEGIGIVQPAEFVRSLPDDGSAGKG